ncbi:MAG: 7TM-DISM domain-containing protein [Cytophagales bacterium]
MMKQCLVLFIAFFAGYNLFAAQIKLGELPTEFTIFLPPFIEALEDRDRKLSINDVLTSTSINFHKPAVESHLGISTSAWWIRFEVDNNTVNNWQILVEMQHVHMNIIQFYVVDNQNNALIVEQKTGDIFPFEQRPLLTRNFNFDFFANKGKTYTCYMYLDNGFEPVSLPLYMHTPSAMAKNETLFVFVFAIFCGILLTMGIISLYIFIQYRKVIYLFYTLFTFSDLCWAITNYGFDYQFIWPDQSYLHNKSPLFFAQLSFFFFVPFTLYYLAHLKNYKFLNLCLKINLLLGGALCTAYVACVYVHNAALEPYIVNICYFYFLAYFAVFSYLIFDVYWQSKTTANALFAVGFLSMLAGALINIFRELVPIPVSFLIEHGCMLGLLIEVLFSGFAMSLNINSLLKDRENLLIEKSNYKSELLKTEINAEEKERKRIAEDLHDDLGILLSSAKLEASKSKNPEKIVALIDHSIIKIRTITQTLHPFIIDKFGLTAVVEDFLEDLKLTLPFTLNYQVNSELNIKLENRIHIFRIVTEILNNAIKHSRATLVNFEMIQGEKEKSNLLLINIEDNGIGLNGTAKSKGIGFANIKSRVHILNGKLTITSEKGLKINIEIPL